MSLICAELVILAIVCAQVALCIWGVWELRLLDTLLRRPGPPPGQGTPGAPSHTGLKDREIGLFIGFAKGVK